MTQKSKTRLFNIIKDNFMDYDNQIWIVPDSQTVIYQTLKENQKFYTNIHIMSLKEITDYFHQIK